MNTLSYKNSDLKLQVRGKGAHIGVQEMDMSPPGKYQKFILLIK
jgi:hypothetical protein